jgi:hypothetical protein
LFFIVFYKNTLVKAKNIDTIISSYLRKKLHVVERQHALGNISETEFLRRKFGCQYEVIEFLEKNNLIGDVIDNWSVWHAPSVSFYAKNNTFRTFGFNSSKSKKELFKTVSDGGVKYIFFNTKVKERHLNSTKANVVKTRKDKLYAETALLNYTELIFSKDDCRLYQIQTNEF